MKQSSANIAVALSLLFAIGLVAPRVSAEFSLREWLGLEDEAKAAEETGAKGAGEGKGEAQPAEPAGQDWGKPSGEAGGNSLELAQIQDILANLDGKQRETLLADTEAFRRFVRQEADNRSVLSAARANKLHQDRNTLFLMQRGAENVLRESYLNRLIAGKIPAGFPSEEQMKEYFEKNKERFIIAERLHVWQIFLPTPEGMDDKAVAALEKEANRIANELIQGKMEFGAAAAKHSTHEPSRHNGGYMGLVNVAELKPEIGKSLAALAEGAVSKAVKTDTGFHVLRRGATVPVQPLSFEQAKPRLRQLLLNQARTQLRQAIYEQAKKSYPVDLPDTKVEEWRLRLRTNVEASSGSSAGSSPAAKKQ